MITVYLEFGFFDGASNASGTSNDSFAGNIGHPILNMFDGFSESSSGAGVADPKKDRFFMSNLARMMTH